MECQHWRETSADMGTTTQEAPRRDRNYSRGGNKKEKSLERKSERNFFFFREALNVNQSVVE